MPTPALPEMTLRALAVVPPIVLRCVGDSAADPQHSSTPACVFGMAPVPLAFVPMKLPRIRLSVAPSSTKTPPLVLPEIRLHAPVQGPPGVVPDVPPSVLFVPPSTTTPYDCAIAAVPPAFVPM